MTRLPRRPMEACAGPMLDSLIFSPKIDFVTLNGVARPGPSGLKGKIVWPKSCNGKRLTIHDPTPGDLRLLHEAFPNASLTAIEVAVDMRPRAKMNKEQRNAFLAALKVEFCAKRSNPKFPEGLSSSFRGTYEPRPNGYALRPFNRRVPGPGEQHLHGSKYDAVQFKVYFKIKDNKVMLHWEQHVIRMEVRLNGPALLHHGLEHVGDLLGFRFRHELAPYFRHVRGTVRASARRSKSISPLHELLTAKLQGYDDEHWRKIGVGAFLPGGKRQSEGVRLLRDQALNDRIGQALHRLQCQCSKMKFVCAATAANDENPASMRASG